MTSRIRTALFCVFCIGSFQWSVPAIRAEVLASLELIDGDRVVLLGGTFIERAQRYGWLETALQVRYPDRQIHVRNLGWSADTVFAESRGIFDAPGKGYERMIAQVRDLKPSVILFHYGSNEAFQGSAFLETYLKQYGQLLDDLAPTNAHLVLLSPLPLMHLGEPLPDPAAQNAVHAEFVAATGELAKRRELQFVNLWQPVEQLVSRVGAESLTEDGVHLTESGYRVVSDLLIRELTGRSEVAPPSLTMGANGLLNATDGCRVSENVSREGLLKFRLQPGPPLDGDPRISRYVGAVRVSVTGLAAGDYDVLVNGVRQGSHRSEDLALPPGSESPRALWVGSNTLRDSIVEKNMMYFHRWRPQNVTYLFLFRKHEQGQNAKEIDEFEPIVAGLERKIFDLKSKPNDLAVEIVRSSR